MTFSTITSKLGIYVTTTNHTTKDGAKRAARKAIKSGVADSAAIYTDGVAVAYFGSGR